MTGGTMTASLTGAGFNPGVHGLRGIAALAVAVEPDSLTARLLSARPAQFLGTISCSLYLVHPYFYLPARLAFERWPQRQVFGGRRARGTRDAADLAGSGA
ncbi:hypothetical protein [Frigidibacter oleivorans]|uniref:hypothetical protein n=1 Tax=Frigidibacter oleivorans TaxID=2487129 RepID=UPI000F8E3439|nr:hypothetical protein [Frigidibacter oleivorans]